MTSRRYQLSQSIRLFLSAMISVLLISSCSLTRTVEEDEYLLNKVKVKIDNRNLKGDVSNLIKQKPNTYLLWVMRFKLRFYNSFLFKKDAKYKLRTSIGEPPVIYDSSSAAASTRQIHAFLKNRGYYQNKVSFKEKKKGEKSKKIKVIYEVELGEPTIIAGIEEDIENYGLSTDLFSQNKKSYLKVGDNFDVDVLEMERKRLSRVMQNRAYFFFSNDLIFYKVDTIREKHKAFITYKLREDPVKYFGDSVKVDPYSNYKIDKITVRQDFGSSFNPDFQTDTTKLYGYHFVSPEYFSVKPKVVSRSIFHRNDEYYFLENHENTYRRLVGLNNYKSVNISYNPSMDTTGRYVNCLVSLSPAQPMSFSIETNGTNTGGILGVNFTGTVQHRNAFRGAELLRFSIYGGLEAQSVKTGDDVVENTPFNTIEVGPELSLVIPKFLLPVNQETFAKRFVPKTTFTTSYNYQRRPDYTRNIVNAGMIYSWKESKTKSHAIQPINISQIQIFKTEEFQKVLNDLNNSSLKASYEDNLISSIMYNFVYNDQVLNQNSTHQIFRANLELAGNLIYFVDRNITDREPNEDGFYEINGIPYAQFARAYVEYVPHIYINRGNQIVLRTFAGLGRPYGNASSMPFVRSFYAGGSNGVRAWLARRLGPGSVSNDTLASAQIDQIGDLKLEQNVEYRFKIYKYLEGAVFTDIGNIWLVGNPQFEEAANFQFANLWRDLAMAGGVGMRLNFDYFVIRLDVAKRIKDPGEPDPFAIKFFYAEDAVFNFAIGYPF